MLLQVKKSLALTACLPFGPHNGKEEVRGGQKDVHRVYTLCHGTVIDIKKIKNTKKMDVAATGPGELEAALLGAHRQVCYPQQFCICPTNKKRSF
jgi:hypothetical protein